VYKFIALLAGGPVAASALVAWNLRKSWQGVRGGTPPAWTWPLGAAVLAVAIAVPTFLVGMVVYFYTKGAGAKGKGKGKAGKSIPWQAFAAIASICVGLFLIVFPEPVTTVVGLGLVVGGATTLGVFRDAS
jgi:hypothetical protein